MNFDKLQQDWKAQNNLQLDLVLRLFRESQYKKVDNKIRRLTIYSILFMVYNLFVLVFALMVMLDNLSNYFMLTTSIIMIIFSMVVFYMNVFQINSLSKLDYSKPITELQSTISLLKINRVKHNRFIFVFSNMYFWGMVSLFLQWDLWQISQTVWANAPIVLIIHLGLLILWFPLALWILKKYDQADGNKAFWGKLSKDSFLTDQSTNFSLNEALSDLHEIESFSNE